MANHLQLTPEGRQPAVRPPPMPTLLQAAYDRILRHLSDHPTDLLRSEIRVNFAPTEAERKALAERQALLLASQAPADPADDRITAGLELLMSTCQTYGLSADETPIKLKAYTTVLSARYPAWAIYDACYNMASAAWHRVDTQTWKGQAFPSAGEIIIEVREVLVPTRAEEYRIRRILNAEIWGLYITEENHRKLEDIRKSVALGPVEPENERLMREVREEAAQRAAADALKAKAWQAQADAEARKLADDARERDADNVEEPPVPPLPSEVSDGSVDEDGLPKKRKPTPQFLADCQRLSAYSMRKEAWKQK